MRVLTGVLVLTLTLVLHSPLSGWAAGKARPISDFFGTYVGQSISVEGEGLSARDLSVTIKETREGFNLSWTTVTRRQDQSPNRKSYSIDFAPSPRKGIYGSAMRRDAFGNRRPVDPLRQGDPFVWATLKGSTLRVQALLITGHGSYELQTYERTLTANGMQLTFTRLRNGKQLKVIKGVLKKK